jgi:hypothetical protein
MFKVAPASLQTNCVLEDRVQYSTVHIPNVFCDGHLQIINCVGIVRMQNFFVFLYCNHRVHIDFLITLHNWYASYLRDLVLKLFKILLDRIY